MYVIYKAFEIENRPASDWVQEVWGFYGMGETIEGAINDCLEHLVDPDDAKELAKLQLDTSTPQYFHSGVSITLRKCSDRLSEHLASGGEWPDKWPHEPKSLCITKNGEVDFRDAE